jgi:hypothetical protein
MERQRCATADAIAEFKSSFTYFPSRSQQAVISGESTRNGG